MAKRKSQDQVDLTAAKVAYLKTLGVPQHVIADRVELTPSTISRLLAEGGDAAEYLKVQPPQFDWSKLRSEDHIAQIKALGANEKASTELTDLVAKVLEHSRTFSIHIVGSRRRGRDLPGANNRHADDEFYDGALSVVWNLLAQGDPRVAGLTWGLTLSKVLASARRRRLASPLKSALECDVIPLCGESLGASRPLQTSSSILADGFADVLTGLSDPSSTGSGAAANGGGTTKESGNRSINERLALFMVPIFFPGPKAFSSAEVEACEKLLRFSVSYNKIFASKSSLASRLDVILTSVSRESKPFGFGEQDHETWKALRLEDIAKYVMGDLGGIPLLWPKLHHSSAQKKIIDDLLKRWTGLREEHAFSCAERASRGKNRSAGVIVIADDPEKAGCVIESVRMGLINHAIVSASLADALTARMKGYKRGQTTAPTV